MWPIELRHPPVALRPLLVRDERAWREVRQRNQEWLRPWDATLPPGPVDGLPAPANFRSLVRRLSRQARVGAGFPFALLADNEFAGQVTVSNVVRGSAQFASLGYWIDQRHAGRGIMPIAVAMVIDHCFFVAGLHRMEIAIRPENRNSLRVVEKLGIERCGTAPRYLHIDGAWRDHLLFGITVEECPGGLLRRHLGLAAQ